MLQDIVLRLPYPLKNLVFSLYGFRLIRSRKRNLEKYIDEFIAFDALSSAQQDEVRESEMQKMLLHARMHVPFYRKHWNLNPGGDASRLENWPVITKQDIRGNEEAFIADGYRKDELIPISTSGTSGTPMKFFFDADSYARWYALYYYRLLIKNGIHLDDDVWANFGGRIICPASQSGPPFWIYNSPMRQLYLSSYHISDNNLPHYISILETKKVVYIVGYPSSIYALARYIVQYKVKHSIRLKAVFTNAEPLFDFQREAITAAFGCRVVQTYGSSEFALAASEDEEGRMAIWLQSGILEVAKPDTKGCGEFLVSGLVNKAMPLIRYQIGDSGTVEPCVTYPRFIQSIEGRTDDIIYSPSGRFIGRLDPIFKNELKIKEAQIIQEAPGRICFLVVKEEGYSEKEETLLKAEAEKRLGTEFQLELRYTDKIPRTANGKFKAVVSKITKHA